MRDDEVIATCRDCARSYGAGDALHCGAGSTQEPRPYWATKDAVLRIMRNGGERSGMERAENIDPAMASDCAAFEPKREDKP